MVWKKNFVSVILWAVYFTGISAALMYYSYEAVIASGLVGPDIALCVAIGALGGIVLLFFLCRLIAKRIPANFLSGNSEMADIIKGVLFIALITAGLFLRIVNIDSAGESAAYYDVAKVTANGAILEVTHGATFFYVYLLRILFTVVGNKWIAGIWLQLVLQFVAAILLYVAARKFTGAVAGLILLASIMLLPTEVMRGITYTPHICYLCIYAIGLLGVSTFLERQSCSKRKCCKDVMLLLFCGAWIGMVCYLDVTGLTLLIPVLFALHVKKAQDTGHEVVWSVFVVLILAVLFFTGFLCVDAYICDKNVLNILYAWFEMFCVKAHDIWFWQGEEILTGMIVLGFMVFGALGFWLAGKYHRFSLWITILCLLCVMDYFQIPAQNMDAGMISLVVGSILGGIGIRECFAGGMIEEAAVDDTIVQSPEEVEAVNKEEDLKMEDLKMEEAPKQVKYIENPLPLPKKHVKKVLDYSVHPQEAYMHYDIDVAEDDDFDL